MDNFNPFSIWAWYTKKPLWFRVLSFLFIFLAIAVACVFVWLTTRRFNGSEVITEDDPLQETKNDLEEYFRRSYADTVKIDESIQEDIREIEKKEVELKKERENAFEKNKEAHEAVDSVNSIAGIDDIVRGYVKKDFD